MLLATRENQLPPGHSSIFSAKSYGPFSIVADVGRQAFRLDLPNTVYIHLVLHVSHVKHYVSPSIPAEISTPPFVYADQRGGIYEVETILAKEKVGKSWRYLLKWTAYDDYENTWEPLANIRHLTDFAVAAPQIL